MANMKEEVMKGWQQLAAIARKTKRFQTSQYALLKASNGAHSLARDLIQ